MLIDLRSSLATEQYVAEGE